MKRLAKEHACTFLTGLGALVAVWLLGCGTMVAQSSLNHSVLEDALKRTEIELTKKEAYIEAMEAKGVYPVRK